MNNCVFHPVDPPRAVFDRKLGKPVILLGHWRNEFGALVGTEISTFSQCRHPSEVREILTPAAVSVITA